MKQVHLHLGFPLTYSIPLHCCLTSTEVRWPIRDGDRVGRGQQSEGSTAETAQKRPDRVGRGQQSEGSTAETARKRLERPWTAARTMEVLRRCPLAIAQRLVHCAIAVSTAVLVKVTKTMSVALLLTNNLDNSKQKISSLLSPAPPLLRVQLHLPPLRSLDFFISPGTLNLLNLPGGSSMFVNCVCIYITTLPLIQSLRYTVETISTWYWQQRNIPVPTLSQLVQSFHWKSCRHHWRLI